MSRAYWKAGHVKQAADLPYKLTKGKAYFIDVEGWIAIDHGDNRGIQIYGNKEGIQGPTGELILQMRSQLYDLLEKFSAVLQDSVENDSSVQQQIDSLSFTAIKNAIESAKAHDRRKAEIQNEANTRAESDRNLQEKIDALTELEADDAAEFRKISKNLQTQIDSVAETQSFDIISLREVDRTLQENINNLNDDNFSLQTQADSLAETGLNNALNIYNEAETRRKGFEQTEALIENIQKVDEQQNLRLDSLDNDVKNIDYLADNDSCLQAQNDSLAETGLNNSISINNEAEQRRKADSELNTKIEAITNEYATTKEKVDAIIEIGTDNIKNFGEQSKNLQNEIDSLSEIQQQADSLAKSGLDNSVGISSEAEKRREDIAQIREDTADNNSCLQAQNDSLAQASLENAISISNEAEVRRKEFLETAKKNEISEIQQQTDSLTETGLNNSISISNEAHSRRKDIKELNEKIEAVRCDEANNNSALQNQTDLLAHNLLLSYLNLLKRKNEVIIKSDSGQLQQIDTLAQTGLNNSLNISSEAEKRRKGFQQTVVLIEDNDSGLQTQNDNLAEASLENAINISNEAEKRRSLSSKIEDTQEKVNAIIEIGSDKIKKFCERSQNLQNEIDSLADNESHLQEQVDSLANSDLNNTLNISNEAEKRREGIVQIHEDFINNTSCLREQDNSLAEASIRSNLILHEALEQRRKMLAQEIFTRIEQGNKLQSQINLLCEICLQIMINHSFIREKYVIAQDSEVNDMLNQTYNS